MDEEERPPEPVVEYKPGPEGTGQYHVIYPDRRFDCDQIVITERMAVSWEQDPQGMKDALLRVFDFRRRQEQGR